MSDLEDFLKENAVFGAESHRAAPVREWLERYKTHKLSNQGMLSEVYRIEGEPWVVKEGKWDVNVKLVGDARVKVPPELAEKIWKERMLPRKEEIYRQLAAYKSAVDYFGFFAGKNYWHPEIETIHEKQARVRESLGGYLETLSDKFKITWVDRLEKVLEKDVKFHNFLPREYMLIGEGRSKGNEGKETYYIFQEFKEGRGLHKMTWKDIWENRHVRDEMTLLTMLMLVFYMEEKLVLDTRPHSPLVQMHDWLLKTDNILVSKEGVQFIDTRWMWKTDENLVQRGFVVPELIVLRARWCLNQLLHPDGKAEPWPALEHLVSSGMRRPLELKDKTEEWVRNVMKSLEKKR